MIYRKLIIEKTQSFNDFDDIQKNLHSYKSLVIQKDKPLTTYRAENADTYFTKYIESYLYQNQTELLINSIKSGYSMFHDCDQNNTIYVNLLGKLSFIKKCYYINWCMKMFDPFVPIELRINICKLMMQSYVNNERMEDWQIKCIADGRVANKMYYGCCIYE